MRVVTVVLFSAAAIFTSAALGLFVTWIKRPSWLKRWQHIAGLLATVVLATAATSAGLLMDRSPAPRVVPPAETASRTLEGWASDVNTVCADHAEEMQEGIIQTRTSGQQAVQISQEVQESGDTEGYVEELDQVVVQAFDAAATVDAVHTTILRKARSIELPESDQERAASESWLASYEGLADEFASYYESLANYLQSTNVLMKSYFLAQMTTRIDSYNQLAIEVADEGVKIGIESC